MPKKISSTAIMSKSFLLAALLGGVFVILTEPALAQGGPPPGAGGGNSPVTLDGLGCGPNEIARVNAADEWECSASLTADEGDIVTLQTSLATLQTSLAALTAQIGALQAQVDDIAANLSTTETAIADLQAAQGDIGGLADYVNSLAAHIYVVDRFRDVDGDGVDDPVPTVVFEEANVQIISGDPFPIAGRGNLIVGFDQLRSFGNQECSFGEYDNQADCEKFGHVWALNHKSGFHNLIVGDGHAYSSVGGVVFGDKNTINRVGATVLGGFQNTASGPISSVSGGAANMASGDQSSVSGGSGNVASGPLSSVSGGFGNTASGGQSSVSGGSLNTASATRSSVSGGDSRTAPELWNWAAGSLLEAN